MRTAPGISLALSATLAASAAQALTPMPACDREENGMYVHSGESFGQYRSGFTIESYFNLTSADGIIAGAKGPIPELDNFNGIRITDCRRGDILALNGAVQRDAHVALTATEFLRERVKSEQPIRMREIKRAARAIYGSDDYVKILHLRETEQTCACAEIFPDMWGN